MQVLVTGGAGFIGSHLATALAAENHQTRVFDDLSTGFLDNVPAEAELIEGNISDPEAIRRAATGADVVFHLAAHRAVLRSVNDPIATDLANTHGTVAALKAAVDAGARRIICASSSSVYGGAEQRPTPESAPLMPRSPYAVSKLAGEHYCRVFAELYPLETVSMRYFNVYGPRQRPDSAYAAVIPLFIEALQNGDRPIVHGDGLQTRAFAYIDDVVDAHLKAAAAPSASCQGQAYNIAGRDSHSLLDLLGYLGDILGVVPDPVFGEVRAGDVRHTSADITAATRDLGYDPKVSFQEGLARTVRWAAKR